MGRVLVTGSNGFVGNHLVRQLVNSGLEVVTIGGEQGTSQVVDGVVQHHVLDLLDRAAVKRIDFTNVMGVIHLAGLATAGPSFAEPMLYMNANVGMETNLFEAALAQKVTPRFLIISSGNVYSSKAKLPLTENSAVLPNSPYSVSKLSQELMAEYYGVRGLEYIIARPFNHIGPGQGPGFIVPDITSQLIAVEQGTASTISVGNLDAQRDYTDVRDIARAYQLLLQHGKAGETYNICSGQPVSSHEILAGLLKQGRQKPEITQDRARMRPSDIPISYGSHDKLSRDTGWEPEISIDQTLADVVDDWHSRN